MKNCMCMYFCLLSRVAIKHLTYSDLLITYSKAKHSVDDVRLCICRYSALPNGAAIDHGAVTWCGRDTRKHLLHKKT